jgi:hypothetical protein
MGRKCHRHDTISVQPIFMIGDAKSHRKVTPHSRLLRRGCVDGRSREGRFLRAVRSELAEMVGGEPTPAQRAIIDRVAWLRLHVTLLDEKVGSGAILSDHDVRHYLSYTNAIVRAMARLGAKAKGHVAKPDPHAYLEALRERAGAAA